MSLPWMLGITSGFMNGAAAANGYPMGMPWGGGYCCYPQMRLPFYGGRRPFLMFNNAAYNMIGGGVGTCYWGGGGCSTPRINTAAIDAQVSRDVNASMLQFHFQQVSSDYTKITAMIKSIDTALADKDNQNLTDTIKAELESLKTKLEEQKNALEKYKEKATSGDVGDVTQEDLKSAHEAAKTVITEAESSFTKIKADLAKKAEASEDAGGGNGDGENDNAGSES